MAKLLSRRKPSLVQSRHMMMTRFKNDPYHRFLYRHLEGMVAVTQEVADQLERFIPGDIRPRVEVIYLGVEAVAVPERSRVDAIRAELGMEGKFAVGMLGRINRPKGQHLLIEAIAMLDDPSIEAVFVGSEMEAGYIDALRGRAAELGVSQRVRFLGFMKEPSRFLQGCDVVVMASRCETFGLVLIEAMHAHTAVIGSDRCGVREIIDDGETGLMFASEDPRSLADQIARLKGDPALCARLAEAGYQKALERFESQHHFDRMAEYFRGLTQ
jgi:glycosyltransferase involved in cell wall biosynthesis